jgi:SAM-dependent methyltransferase
MMLTVHWEMQRLAEEFYHGHRVLRVLRATIGTLRSNGFAGPIRIVDVGCGIGYTIRWLAARTLLPQAAVELTGVDLNSALVKEANRLAAAEALPCRFFHGDAFSADLRGHIYISTGVLHHFRGEDLVAFLRRHDSIPGRQPTLLTLHTGSWRKRIPKVVQNQQARKTLGPQSRNAEIQGVNVMRSTVGGVGRFSRDSAGRRPGFRLSHLIPCNLAFGWRHWHLARSPVP